VVASTVLAIRRKKVREGSPRCQNVVIRKICPQVSSWEKIRKTMGLASQTDKKKTMKGPRRALGEEKRTKKMQRIRPAREWFTPGNTWEKEVYGANPFRKKRETLPIKSAGGGGGDVTTTKEIFPRTLHGPRRKENRREKPNAAIVRKGKAAEGARFPARRKGKQGKK